MKTDQGLTIIRRLEDALDPARLALVVYDVQVGIRRQIKDGDTIVRAIAQVLEASRAAGVRVFYSRHMSLPKKLMGAMQIRTSMAWQRIDNPADASPWFLRDSPDFQITPELRPGPDEAILDKITMSVFEGTPLAIALRDCDVNAVMFVGIALEIGIEPSARHAADLGFVPIIVADACGHGNAEAAERSLAALTFTGDAIITDVATLCRQLGGRGADVQGLASGSA
ncbi:MAG: cysteine hydrolase [Bradyrhizobium sp.]|nr:MAG: cysteine hydrolase [Bradyrhizobium sp.]